MAKLEFASIKLRRIIIFLLNKGELLTRWSYNNGFLSEKLNLTMGFSTSV
jgi:hypothetical protein